MQPPQRLAIAALWAVSLSAVCGCGPDFFDQVEDFATPTGALESGDADLVRQVRAIEQAGGLAEQLARPPQADESNAAFLLAASYSDALHLRLTPLVESLLEPDADPTKRAALLESNKLLLEKTAAAADLASCQFAVGHRYGFFARMSYLDDAKEASRLLQLRAVHSGAVGESAAAVGDLIRSLRIVHWLSKVRRVEARVLAATLRHETLQHAAAMIEAGEIRRFECEQLYGALRDQLADWPDESRMLVGERATVIHSYEAIRAGMLAKLITLAERKELTAAGHLDRMDAASPEDINEDESAYLSAMEQVLATSDEPYPARNEAIGLALGELSQRPSLFARTLFIDDLPDAIWHTCADRAMTEAWTIALSSAASLRLPPFRESPLSGLPYEVENDDRRVTVTYGQAEDLRVSLPMMAKF